MARRQHKRIILTERGQTDESPKAIPERPDRHNLNTLNRERGRQNTIAPAKPLTKPVITNHTPHGGKLPWHRTRAAISEQMMKEIGPLMINGGALKLRHHVELDTWASKDYPYSVVKFHLSREWDPGYDLKKETIGVKNSMVLYLGETRIDELNTAGEIIRVLCPILLIGTGVYTVLDLALLAAPW